ncbi:uncharacterized protein [Procambarus clarkii]|uniref:uncharacterized protein n=1 Tax=Procambarus clarkii TaxID=6728 RepID=UPI0037427F54
MQLYHPSGSLVKGLVLLMVLQGALALPQVKGKNVKTSQQQTGICHIGQVDSSHDVQYVPLKERLVFIITPSEPVMYMRIKVADELYKVTVMGSMVKLWGCSDHENDCNVKDEGGSKSNDLLQADIENKVTITLHDNKISVDINMKSSVMQMTLPSSTKGPQTGEVSIVATDPTATIPPPATYTVDVSVECIDGVTPVLRTDAPLPIPVFPTKTSPTNQNIPTAPRPFKECPFYKVELEHPLPFISLQKSLSLAVFPSQSLLYIRVLIDGLLFKVIVENTTLKLLKCDVQDLPCKTMKENGYQNSNVLLPEQWNTVNITHLNNMLKVLINGKASVEGSTILAGFEGTHSSEVSIVAIDDSAIEAQADYYSVDVNIDCNDTFTPVIREDVSQFTIPSQFTVPSYSTENPFVTPEHRIDTSTDSPETSKAPVGIIIGVLIALIVIIAAAIGISIYKKRRSADINQHTPLRDQQQVQQ